MVNRYYKTYQAWKRACKVLGATLADFTGDKDIDGVYIKEINLHAEWDGEMGVIDGWE